MIEKNYQPSDIESRMAQIWEESGAFQAGRPERRDAATFSIVIPPPNVTGSLHMGHALNNTLQDILCRFERMRGKDVLWQPGTDHAGIATQMVVERQLMERQEPGRRDIGRAKFLERVWQWKAESGGTIVNQLKRLGASCDWSRERFTMDEGLSKAVIKVFVELHREGLIYKDKRLVNWDPELLTAISDLEVQQVEVKGNLWYLRYPIEGRTFDPSDPQSFIVVATTRPETMLGDTAVAVHPENPRLGHLIGQNAIVPLVDRIVPIVGDEYADPEKGTGAVKITPAHDFNDFDVWQRHKDSAMRRYPPINIFSPEGNLILDPNLDFKRGDPTPETFRTIAEFNGLDRFVARKRIVARLDELGLLERIEPHVHMVPHGDRSGVVVEPRLTDQWYVDAKALAQPALAAVRDGKTTFVPKNWEKTYFDWMENIQPWCISRQLWWGHQIPAWYGPSKLPRLGEVGFGLDLNEPHIFVASSEEEAIAQAQEYYGAPVKTVPGWTNVIDAWETNTNLGAIAIARDEDVLDTWFSSGLWPFSTLGWPNETSELQRYYPTNTLVTGFDIIFFWVARMMMLGLHFMKEVPFSTVYIHALVRDEKGAKMSKSKGNVIDPLHLIDEYGADALRFTLAAMAAQGRDIKLSTQRVEGYRNFATKLWNACRFAEMNEAVTASDFDPSDVKEVANQWIISQFSDTLGQVEIALDDYRFNDAATRIYQFVWNSYCDWYVELTKPVFLGLDENAKKETRATLAFVRDEILKILHPFMPFITEELWQVTASQTDRRTLLTLAEWPSAPQYFADAHEEIGWLIELINAVRSVRAEMNVPASTLVQLEFVRPSDVTLKRIKRWDPFFNRLARISGTYTREKASDGAVQLVVGGEVVALPLKGVIDLTAERARLEKEIGKADGDIKRVDAKLANEKFVANAPEEIVEEEKEKREAAVARKTKHLEALERLDKASQGQTVAPGQVVPVPHRIFLSHNSKDKPVVEPVAIRLAQIFGQNQVFYDSWSIRPGDGIIDQMNKGLEAPEFVFFFVSANSLKSEMVKLEWQNALYRASKGKTRIIPIRVDGSAMPPILAQNLYIDMYTIGLEAALAQIVGVAEGNASFTPQHQGFSNLTFSVHSDASGAIDIVIKASRFMEANPNFMILVGNQETELTWEAPGVPGFYGGFNANVRLDNGTTHNGITMRPMNATLTPAYPVRLRVRPKDVAKVDFRGLLYQASEQLWKSVPQVQ